MVNYKILKITEVHKRYPSYQPSYIQFVVDNTSGSAIPRCVEGKVSDYGGAICCVDAYPFSTYMKGDYLEINLDEYYYDRISVFDHCDDTNIVRRAGSLGTSGHSHAEYETLRTRCSSLESENYSLRSDRDRWKSEYNRLERERNDLRSDRDSLASGQDEWRRKHEDIKTQLSGELSNERLRNASVMASEKLDRQNTESTLRNEKAVVEEKFENAKTEKVGLLRQIEDVKNELSLVRVEKDNQLALVKVVEKEMADLRVEREKEKAERDTEINKKEEELRRKEEEINDLRNQKEFSEEELLNEKLRSEERKLELFAAELKVDSEKKDSLIKDYEQLIQAQKTRNRTNANTYKSNVDRTKRDLQSKGISIVNVQEICSKCERMAELNWELEKIQQQQFQAQQEIPTNN